jgi:anti-sigma factor RsiW
MTQHVTNHELARLRGRQLTPEKMLAVVRHLESCPECAGIAAETVDCRAAAETWSETLHAALDDHLRDDGLLDYADGRLSPNAMDEAGAHLEHCATCREDVADLRRLRVGGRRRWPRLTFRVAAVLVVATGVGALSYRTPRAAPVAIFKPSASVRAAQPEADVAATAWTSLVKGAVAGGGIEPPAIIGTLRIPGETMRGDGQSPSSAVAPNGVVIEDPRPTLRWGASPGAVYTVTLFAGDREVSRSAPLRDNAWRPERALERGLIYRWQVEARRKHQSWIVPRAPQPAPVFRLLDQAAHLDLESARRREPANHLLLGVLAAQYGLQEEAIAQLALHHSAHPDPVSTALLESVRAWRNAERR